MGVFFDWIAFDQGRGGAGAGWRFSESVQAHLLVRNATAETAIVAHRPFGARPNLPRTVLLRLRYSPER